MSWKTHGKTIMELLGALVMAGVVAYQYVADQGVTLSEWVMVLIAVAGVLNVWAASNIPGFDKAKLLVSGIFVVLNLLVGMLTDSHLTGDEVMLLVIQFLSTLGVAGAPAVVHQELRGTVTR
jgi:hypothetical protein